MLPILLSRIMTIYVDIGIVSNGINSRQAYPCVHCLVLHLGIIHLVRVQNFLKN